MGVKKYTTLCKKIKEHNIDVKNKLDQIFLRCVYYKEFTFKVQLLQRCGC